MRENAEAKGRRYVSEGRLTVTHATDRTIRASCKGSGAVYNLGWDPNTAKMCSHLHALRLVMVR